MDYNKKVATLYGGAMGNRTTKEYLDTVRIGEILYEMGYCVKNGGYGGMMEAVSKGITSQGGEAFGFTCKTFPSIIGNDFLTYNTPCENIFERLSALISYSELFIVQIGGLGTLSEVFLTLDIVRKQKIKPKVIFIGEVWVEIMNAVSKVINEKERKLFSIIKNVEELKQII